MLLGRHRGYHSVIRHSRGSQTIALLLAVVVIGLFGMIIVQRMETMRRTGSTAINIVSTRFQLPSMFEQSPSGTWLRYMYSVDGTTYDGYDFRRWTKVAAHAPKVCFDPAHPNDHLLVSGTIRCGIDAGP